MHPTLVQSLGGSCHDAYKLPLIDNIFRSNKTAGIYGANNK